MYMITVERMKQQTCQKIALNHSITAIPKTTSNNQYELSQVSSKVNDVDVNATAMKNCLKDIVLMT